jgi:hypothetical protein
MKSFFLDNKISSKTTTIKDLPDDILYRIMMFTELMFTELTIMMCTMEDIMDGSSVDLPLLKKLDLNDILFKDMEGIMELLSGCLKLEDLSTHCVNGTQDLSIL